MPTYRLFINWSDSENDIEILLPAIPRVGEVITIDDTDLPHAGDYIVCEVRYPILGWNDEGTEYTSFTVDLQCRRTEAWSGRK